MAIFLRHLQFSVLLSSTFNSSIVFHQPFVFAFQLQSKLNHHRAMAPLCFESKPEPTPDRSISYGRNYFPLAADVGQDAVKTALLLGAIDCEIWGITISGKRRTAKTVMARGLHAVLPSIQYQMHIQLALKR